MATILQIINADRNLSLFSRGLKMTDLEQQLSEFGPFTILGPVNLAFSRLTDLSFEQLLEPPCDDRRGGDCKQDCNSHGAILGNIKLELAANRGERSC